MTARGAIYPDLEGKSVIVTGGAQGIGASIVRGFARQKSKVGFIDIAEGPSEELTETVTPEVFDERIAVNLRHAFFAAQAVLPGMKIKGGGAIINFSSISWMAGMGGMAVYTAAKSAMLGLTRSLARDYGPYNIRVNAIAPGWVRTERQVQKWLTPEGDMKRLQAQCLKRWLEPEDIARFVLFLASEEAAAATAQHYVVDLGWV